MRYDGMQMVTVAIAKCMKLLCGGIYRQISRNFVTGEGRHTLVMPKIEVT